ncbi:RNA methyltransferase [Lutibacter sp.]|uniref:TrmH family RNA methyltransferase n=1 Tax=Lutibacter sp. TaxID=1925666 RepID=UPI0025B96344|nr:RNA methyltransferase [Lutibacter sp.]MCF6180695.1 RNA methyltransferase [Lutibacter sp.]
MVFSKIQLKLITSLSQKKYRIKHHLFMVEGIKGVQEFLNSKFEIFQLFTSEELLFLEVENRVVISEKDLKKISNLKNPNKVVALFKIPKENLIIKEGLIVALDEVNDPGNLGTIIRLCDWFGVNQLVCSENTVDCFNPKVVQASMGSLARVSIIYTDLEKYLQEIQIQKFATIMNGESIYKTKLPKNGVIIMGNEANGISDEILNLVTNKITIPRFGKQQQTESLNVATATAIILNEFKRNN